MVFYNRFDFLQSCLNLKWHPRCKSVHELLSVLDFLSYQFYIKHDFVLQMITKYLLILIYFGRLRLGHHISDYWPRDMLNFDFYKRVLDYKYK